MKIVEIKAYPTSFPLPKEGGVRLGIGQAVKRDCVMVKVTTEDGIVGWGESHHGRAHTAIARLIETTLSQLIMGMDAADTTGIWARIYKYQLGSHGMGAGCAMAMSGIDMALWDIAAKEKGVPLVELLGGRVHDTLPACASLHVNHPTIDDSVAAITGYIDEGFRSAKLGLGKKGASKAGRDPDYDVALVRELRAAIGPEPDIMVDAGNGVRWDVETAIRTTRHMEPFAIRWMEEPLHPSNVEGHKRLRQATRTPIAAGEREWGFSGYQRWIESGAIDVFGVDPARVEGVTGFCAIAAAVHAATKTVNAHAWSTAVLTAASLHLSLASPAAILFELKPIPGPMQFDLVEEPFWHDSGLVAAPDRPGHGAEPREAVLQKYRV